MAQSVCEPAYTAYNDDIVTYNCTKLPSTPYNQIHIFTTDTPNDLIIRILRNSTIIHYKVHQSILKQNSHYFRNTLTSCTDQDVVELPRPFYWSDTELHQFIELLYSPEILDKLRNRAWGHSDGVAYTDVPTDKIAAINLATQLKLSLYFDCHKLNEQLIHILIDYMNVHHTKYAVQLYCIATTYKITELQNACQQRMIEHPHDWLTINTDSLKPCHVSPMLQSLQHVIKLIDVNEMP